MAAVTRSGIPSLADALVPASHKHTFPAGAAIVAGDVCRISNSSGSPRIVPSNGTVNDATALYDGVALVSQPTTGEPVTIAWGVKMRWGAGLTPGARYYVHTTAGGLNDAATTGGTAPVAMAVDDTTIFFFPPNR
jgi:hypothetical protein